MNKSFSLFHYLRKSNTTSSKGLTLIECLVAISVIAATSATIAPVMVLSVATRVQNQKAEQALQIAKGEIDRVRLLVERSSIYTSRDLKLAEGTPSSAGAAISASTTSRSRKIGTVSEPNALASTNDWITNSSTYTPDALEAREIDTNGDGDPDFIIQSFRGEAVQVPVTVPPVAPSTTPTSGFMPVAFNMGVRVYDYAAATDDSGNLVSGLEKEPARLGFTSGEGQRGRRPLAVLYTQVINSDNEQSLCEYMDYLETAVPASMKCN